MITWKNFFIKEIKCNYFKNIIFKLHEEIKKEKIIYPDYENIFNAFKFTPFEKIKVVIVGQDPYVKPKQADGLAFSVLSKQKLPPSLKNIFIELCNEYNRPYLKKVKSGSLIHWAKQGVFLLNLILTVEKDKPLSHKYLGWQNFTLKVINYINKYKDKVVFIIWGKQAQKVIPVINKKRHYVLSASHPSPWSVNINFWGCNHFVLTNKILKNNYLRPINWFNEKR